MAEAVLAHHRRAGTMLATAESCTGGAIAAALTDIAGSSDVFERGFVTYSNEAKNELLGVPAPLIVAHGAVSHEVAAAMAEGALAHSRADVAVSVTGIAGPGGGTGDEAGGPRLHRLHPPRPSARRRAPRLRRRPRRRARAFRRPRLRDDPAPVRRYRLTGGGSPLP